MTDNMIPPELEFADDGTDTPRAQRKHQRIRLVAWIVIGALVIAGGGSTILTLLFG